MPLFADIPNLLKLRRKIIGRGQAEIATAVGYKNKSFISLIENGEVQIPIQKIGDIADAYRFENPGDFVKLAISRLHAETFGIFETLLVLGYGFSEAQIDRDLERAFHSVLVDCGIDPEHFIDAPRKVMLAVGELHRLGYECLRLVPEMEGSGGFWRWAIVPAGCVSRKSGARSAGNVEAYPHGSAREGELTIGIGDSPHDPPGAVADLLIRKYPCIISEGKGPDPEYARWFLGILEETAPAGYIHTGENGEITASRSGGAVKLMMPPPGGARFE